MEKQQQTDNYTSDKTPEMIAFENQVKEKIAQQQDDPRRQQYFKRDDRDTVVKTQEEYDQCSKDRIPMSIISFNRAIDLLNKEHALRENKDKLKKKRQQAKQARKRNRK